MVSERENRGKIKKRYNKMKITPEVVEAFIDSIKECNEEYKNREELRKKEKAWFQRTIDERWNPI